MNNENYEPFGDEWKQEMAKRTKPQLIDLLAKKLKQRKELLEAVSLYLDQPCYDSMEAMKTAFDRSKL